MKFTEEFKKEFLTKYAKDVNRYVLATYTARWFQCEFNAAYQYIEMMDILSDKDSLEADMLWNNYIERTIKGVFDLAKGDEAVLKKLFHVHEDEEESVEPNDSEKPDEENV